MVGKLRNFIKDSPLNAIPVAIFILLFFAVVIIYVTKLDSESLVDYRDRYVEENREQTWSEISTIISMGNIASRQNAKFIASEVEVDLLRRYSNLDLLKTEFIKGEFSQEFHTVLKDNLVLPNGSPSSLYQPSYYTLVGMEEGIIAVFSNEATSTLSAPDRQSVIGWDSYIRGLPNQKLAQEATNSVLAQKNKLIFWQKETIDGMDTSDYSSMSLNTLKKVYNDYGIDGLRKFHIISPSYITDSGDIFNTEDYTFMHKNENYKLIILQSFNIGEILDHYKHELTDNQVAQAENIMFINEYIRYKYILSILTVLMLSLISVHLINVYNNKCKGCHPEESEGDETEKK